MSTRGQSLELIHPAGISADNNNYTYVDVNEHHVLSADGSAIVGNTTFNGVGTRSFLPFLWREGSGMFVLTNSPQLDLGFIYGDAVANGGNRAAVTLVGGPAGREGFLWTRTNGLKSLGLLTTGPVEVSGISADGKVIVGRARSVNTKVNIPFYGTYDTWEAFRWTEETGMVGLGDVMGDPAVDTFDSEAIAVSADGETIVGRVRYGGPFPLNPVGYHGVARWIKGGPPQMLPFPPQFDENFSASAISPNGIYIVGSYSFVTSPVPGAPQTSRAFRWSESEGYTILHEFIASEDGFYPAAVSDDGKLVVGHGVRPDTSSEAKIWTADRGVRNLSEVVSEMGLDAEGFDFAFGVSISADGRVIAGSGYLPGVFADINKRARVFRLARWDLPPRKIIVNSVADRPMLPGANCCDTGEKIGNGDIECTLRAAIEAVNAGCGDRIEFAVPGAAIPKITPQTPLPAILSQVDIDGTTQPGGKVEISGTDSTGVCIDLQGRKSIVHGLVINHFTGGNGAGIRLGGGGQHRVVGNYIGTTVSGNTAAFNSLNLVVTNSSGNAIGTREPGAGNIIADALVIAGEASTGNSIVANRIGLGADGVSKIGRNIGIAITGGSGTKIGGVSAEANYIGGFSELAIALTRCNATVIEGNLIGLNVAGVGALGGEVGIAAFGLPEAELTGLTIRSNKVAGVRAGIVITGHKATGVAVTDNTVGVRFDGSGLLPSGVPADHAKFGIRVDGAPSVQVFRNIISGADMNLIVAGTPQFNYIPCFDTDGDGLCDTPSEVIYRTPENPSDEDSGAPLVGGVILGANTIGLNDRAIPPAGVKQRFGIAVFAGARDLQIRNNIVASHSESDIWLRDGLRQQLMQNRIGSNDGINRNSQVGILVDEASDVTIAPSGTFVGNTISFQKKVGVLVRNGASNLVIRGNQIGTGPGGAVAWPNGSGIIAAGLNIAGLRIENNLISGSVTQAVSLELGSKAVLQGNRIGISSAGLALSNKVGVVIKNTPVELRDNTIAYNGTGVLIGGEHPVSIQGGPVYSNGNGSPEAAFVYLDQTIPTPIVFVAQKLVSPTGKVLLSFNGVAPSMALGNVEIEIFGNRAGEKQGRTPLGRKTVPAQQPFSFVLEGDAGSAFDTLPEFTCTATQDGRTSHFAAVTPIKIEVKPIVTGTTSTDISLQWPASLPFILERAGSPSGPWSPVLTVPTIVDGTATLTLPLEGEQQFFRLVEP